MDSKTIAKIAQIASALEVSGYPKPGNVHRTRDFEDMEFEDFVISGIVIGDTIEKATSKVDKNSLQNAGLGKYIGGCKRNRQMDSQQYKSWNCNDDYSNSLRCSYQ